MGAARWLRPGQQVGAGNRPGFFRRYGNDWLGDPVRSAGGRMDFLRRVTWARIALALAFVLCGADVHAATYEQAAASCQTYINAGCTGYGGPGGTDLYFVPATCAGPGEIVNGLDNTAGAWNGISGSFQACRRTGSGTSCGSRVCATFAFNTPPPPDCNEGDDVIDIMTVTDPSVDEVCKGECLYSKQNDVDVCVEAVEGSGDWVCGGEGGWAQTGEACGGGEPQGGIPGDPCPVGADGHQKCADFDGDGGPDPQGEGGGSSGGSGPPPKVCSGDDCLPTDPPNCYYEGQVWVCVNKDPDDPPVSEADSAPDTCSRFLYGSLQWRLCVGTFDPDSDGDGDPDDTDPDDDNDGVGDDDDDGDTDGGTASFTGCDAVPTCTGDEIQCAHYLNDWHMRCAGEGDTVSGGETCAAKPQCTHHDPVQCALLLQTWRLRCDSDSSVQGGTGCTTPPVCKGDVIRCAILKQEWHSACALRALTEGDEEPDLGEDVAAESVWAANDGPINPVTDLDSTGFGLTRSCPGFPVVTMAGMSVDLPASDLCAWFEIMAGLVLLAAYAQAAWIIGGSR